MAGLLEYDGIRGAGYTLPVQDKQESRKNMLSSLCLLIRNKKVYTAWAKKKSNYAMTPSPRYL